MPDMRDKVYQIYRLEQLSSGNTLVHRLHPGAKIIAALVFMVTVISFDRYSLGRLLPLLFYPSVLIALGEIPPGLLFRRCALALPFCLFAGLTNTIIEREIAFSLGPLPVSFGFLSLVVLVFRTLLCVSAVLILVASTPFVRLSDQLRSFRLPGSFVLLLEISYRYIGVLLGEGYAMYTAYMLRGGAKRGVELTDMGSFIGSLFLRSADRAERVYGAMCCRGYGSGNSRPAAGPLGRGDWLYLALVGLLCLLCRLVDVPALIGARLGGLALS
ncbi:MAG: cobalt ECF transporter T component CbiQ [Spirochaetaceae bacterium]|jgi:cobalt/nickel transport system permease protein|nr:cobalt ECF transporter T component CbiQ [Spirochaetaceae bacterium]